MQALDKPANFLAKRAISSPWRLRLFMNHQSSLTSSRISTIPTIVLVRALRRSRKTNSRLASLLAFTLRVRARERALELQLPLPRPLSLC